MPGLRLTMSGINIVLKLQPIDYLKAKNDISSIELAIREHMGCLYYRIQNALSIILAFENFCLSVVPTSTMVLASLRLPVSLLLVWPAAFSPEGRLCWLPGQFALGFRWPLVRLAVQRY
jgi:hypothetical protein